MSTYYNTLQVSKNATPADIKKAYRELSKKYHPDKNNGSKEAEEKFKVLVEAFQVLSNEEKRKQYDIVIRPAKPNVKQQQANASPQAERFNRPQRAWSDFHEIFFQDNHLHMDLEVSYSTWLKGGQVTLPYKRKKTCLACSRTIVSVLCNNCQNTGTIETQQQLRYTIPPRYNLKKELKFTGRGHETKNAPAGDLIISLKILPELLNIGEDLLFVLYTTNQPRPGSILDIEVLEQNIKLRVPENYQSGKRLRLPGRGLNNKSNSGDLYVKIIVPS